MNTKGIKMKDNDFLNFTFLNRYYIKQKEKELKRLEAKGKQLEKFIETEKLQLEQSKIKLEKLNKENIYLKEQETRLKNMIIHNGILLDAENNSYNINEWDNLYIIKKNYNYIILSADNEEIYTLEKDISFIIDDLVKNNYTLSIIAVRVNPKYIKLQLRFTKKEK